MSEEKVEQVEQAEVEAKKIRKSRNAFAIFVLGMLAGVIWVAVVYFLALGAKTLIYKIKHVGPQAPAAIEDTILDASTVTKLRTLEAMIDTYYYEDVESQDLEDGLYKGIMEAVGDPYTCYYTAEELTKQMEDSNGVFQGIGAMLTSNFETGYPEITGVMDDSPALEAGLQAGDFIFKVDGEDVRDQELTTIVSKVRGPEGTTVKLTIYRDGKELEFEVERREITSETVQYELMEDNIGYIKITEFDDVTIEQFKSALEKSNADNVAGLIIDLRANPGGNLDAVVEMCNMICPKGIIVYTEDKYGNKNEYYSDGKSEIDIPLVVLVNQYSASASEIFAGAVKDYGIGTLVGVTTFGKGIVQRIVPLTDGSAIKITVSKYYTPNGINIHGTGIEPDIEVELDAEKYIEEDIDTQLEEGLKVLKEKINE